jgi:peptidoglycan-associated lipoprotein
MHILYARHLVTTSVLIALTLSGCSSLSKKQGGDGESATAAATATNTTDSTAADTATASNSANANGNGSSKASSAEKTAAELLATRIVHFGFDEATVAKADYDTLNAHAKWLSSHKKSRIEINGHTDERGTAEYNMALGEKRAKAVAAYLRTHGVAAAAIADVVSFGESKPLNTESTEEAWAENRRVEIVYLKEAP